MALFRRTRKPVGAPGEWYYCLEHGKVEEGPECPARDRMGPYPTPADAARAMQAAAERNEEWDTDPRWHNGQDEKKDANEEKDADKDEERDEERDEKG